MIETYTMSARSGKHLPNDWSTLRVLLDGRTLVDGSMPNRVVGSGNAVIGGDTTFTYHSDIGVYEPVPSDPYNNADSLESGEWPVLLSDESNALLQLTVFRYVGSPTGGGQDMYGISTLRSPSDTANRLAISNNGSFHTRVEENSDYASAFITGVPANQLTVGTDYCFISKFKAGATLYGAIEEMDGTQIAVTNDTITSGTISAGFKPSAGAWIQDMALYGMWVFEFNTNFPADLDAGIDWMRNSAINGVVSPYPAWINL